MRLTDARSEERGSYHLTYEDDQVSLGEPELFDSISEILP